jgi:hypothetical protein
VRDIAHAEPAALEVPRYPDFMAAQPVMTAEEWLRPMKDAAPATDDDVSILWDGTRLDSREAVMKWLAGVDAKRSKDLPTADPAVSHRLA